ncbi:MAG: glycosyltransferase family 61 protein [Candidatus Hydrogenedentota bacterium]
MIELTELTRGKNVFIWGTGALSRRISRFLSVPIHAYVDNNSAAWHGDAGSASVNPPDRRRVEDPRRTIVIVASQRWNEIAPQLAEMGFRHRESVIDSSELILIDGAFSHVSSENSIPVPAAHRSSEEWIYSRREENKEQPEDRLPRILSRVQARPIRFPDSVTIDDEQHWYIRKSATEFSECRSYHVCSIPGARIFGEAGEIISPDGVLLEDLSADYYRPVSQREIMMRAGLPKPAYFDLNMAVASTPGGDNYFHWLKDVLVRLFLYKDLDLPVDRFVINYQGAAFQDQLLRMLHIPTDKIIGSAVDLHLAARTIYRASPVEDIPYLRGKLARLMDTCLDPVNSGASSPKRRIYISRAKSRYRHIQNESAVFELLRGRFGFEMIFSEDLSVREQARIFNEAEIVVGAHGANLTNTLFCRPGCVLLEFFHPEWVNICYWRLAHEGGLVYGYLMGEGDVSEQGEDRFFERPGMAFEGFTVDTAKLERLLEKVMSHADL